MQEGRGEGEGEGEGGLENSRRYVRMYVDGCSEEGE